jgi:hypothetical protein
MMMVGLRIENGNPPYTRRSMDRPAIAAGSSRAYIINGLRGNTRIWVQEGGFWCGEQNTRDICARFCC